MNHSPGATSLPQKHQIDLTNGMLSASTLRGRMLTQGEDACDEILSCLVSLLEIPPRAAFSRPQEKIAVSKPSPGTACGPPPPAPCSFSRELMRAHLHHGMFHMKLERSNGRSMACGMVKKGSVLEQLGRRL